MVFNATFQQYFRYIVPYEGHSRNM